MARTKLTSSIQREILWIPQRFLRAQLHSRRGLICLVDAPGARICMRKLMHKRPELILHEAVIVRVEFIVLHFWTFRALRHYPVC